jgi:hypothetical protein
MASMMNLTSATASKFEIGLILFIMVAFSSSVIAPLLMLFDRFLSANRY